MNKPYHKDFDVPLHAFKQHDKDLPERPLVLNDVYIGARGTLFNEQKEVVYINSISKFRRIGPKGPFFRVKSVKMAPLLTEFSQNMMWTALNLFWRGVILEGVLFKEKK